MIDAVLGWHMNPLTCGVAKFNHQLAKRLGVPCLSLADLSGQLAFRHALVSVKFSELPASLPIVRSGSYDLMTHDRQSWMEDSSLYRFAERVFYADTVGCPSTLQGNASRGDINVLTFGMAHKRVLPHYEKFKRLLDDLGEDYTVSVSCGVHEGNSWSEAWAETERSMRSIFGDHLRVLGFLADDALDKELRECTAVALFYDPALRANNTTFWAAYELFRGVFTNLDATSPRVPGVWDIETLQRWPEGKYGKPFGADGYAPTNLEALKFVASGGHTYTWDHLVDTLTAQVIA